MTSQDQATFDQWIEQCATAEERALPYEKQLEAHILWLSGFGLIDLDDFIPEEEH